MVLADLKNHNTQRLEGTEVGQTVVKNYVSLAEEHTEEQLTEIAMDCQSNHFWDMNERMVLMYFGGKLDWDWEALKSDYFPHRTINALKQRYKKMLSGEDTPANTPRLSVSGVSNMVKKSFNKGVKLLTPSATPVKNTTSTSHNIEEEEEEEDVSEDILLLEDTIELEEEEVIPDEDIEEEEELVQEEAEEVEELEEAEMETEEANEAETKEQAGGLDIFMAITIPFVLIMLFTLVVVLLPEEDLRGPNFLTTYKSNLAQLAAQTTAQYEEFIKKMTQQN